jgi:integrase
MSNTLIQPSVAPARPPARYRSRALTPPAYCHHKAKGLAYVRLNEEFIYLGAYESEESKAEYRRIIAEWMATGRTPKQAAEAAGPSLNEVLLGYWRFAEGYYRSGNGDRKGELERIAYAVKPLKDLYGTTPAADFGPLALKAVRQNMIDAGLCRTTVNQRVGCIKRIFKWAASEELVPSGVFHGLQSVEGLRRGRSAAKEAEPVRPVPDAHVDAALPFLPPTVGAMVGLHRITGMRSGELCLIRTCDVDTSGAVWIYRPATHKTAYRGHQRVVQIGPQGQAALRPYLRPEAPQVYVFSPQQAQAERNATKRLARKSKVQPSQMKRKKQRPKKQPGERYDTKSYFHAIRYAIQRAIRAGALTKEQYWHPHQLRHNYATLVRRAKGLDAARALLGHRTVSQTAEYAELDAALASVVAAELG